MIYVLKIINDFLGLQIYSIIKFMLRTATSLRPRVHTRSKLMETACDKLGGGGNKCSFYPLKKCQASVEKPYKYCTARRVLLSLVGFLTFARLVACPWSRRRVSSKRHLHRTRIQPYARTRTSVSYSRSNKCRRNGENRRIQNITSWTRTSAAPYLFITLYVTTGNNM